MRGTRAKAMRRAVETMTPGMPNKQYIVENLLDRHYKDVFGHDRVMRTGTFKLSNSCTRYWYKRLKRGGIQIADKIDIDW